MLLEVLADERLAITTAIADGMSTHDYPNIKSRLGKEIYLFFFTGFFYQMMGKAGPMRKRLITRLTGRKPEEADRLLYPDATWQSWKNQAACLIGRPVDFEVFENTDLHIWHGINSPVERKLAKDIQKWQDAGYAFSYKVFRNVGHGGLIAEHTEQFIEEVKAVYSPAKTDRPQNS